MFPTRGPLVFLPLFLSLALLVPAGRAWGGVGTTTADILKINTGVRPAGMGGVYSALGDDAYSVIYNPAGLVSVKATQVALYHLSSLADISYEYLTAVTAWGTGNALALNVVYRHMPPIDNDNGQPAVTASDLLLSLSYARRLSENFRAGMTVKTVRSDFGFAGQPAEFSASAVALDLGVQLTGLPFGLRAGAAVQNLGTSMTFRTDGEPDPLPLFLRGGLGTRQVFEGRDLNAAVEVFMPSDQSFKLGAGVEFWLFPDLFAVRGGYKFDLAEEGLHNVFHNYTLGCTLTRRIDGDDFSVDIAYNPAAFVTTSYADPDNPVDLVSTSQDTLFIGLNFKFNQFRIF